MQPLLESIYNSLLQTTWIEVVAVIAGIASVWYSRKENILVYPIGIINTALYIYISAKGHLLGEASVNVYYTIMSIYGWYLWTRKKEDHKTNVLEITNSTKQEWVVQLLFFAFFYIVLYAFLTYLKTAFAPEAIPWADALASASAYTGMWLMARKKVESWIWWIVTNLASIPLYFVKGYAFTSIQFLILLVLAVAGLITWRKKAKPRALKKIVVLGPESTGKSTLCAALAKHYKTEWCPEFARQYLAENGTKYTHDDLLTIAKGQLLSETQYVQIAQKTGKDKIIIDTDMYVMKVWSEYVFNNCDPYILEKINEQHYDVYLLCDIDLPWTKDEMREYPDEAPRKELFTIYKEMLINQKTPWGIVSGIGEARTENAIQLIEQLTRR